MPVFSTLPMTPVDTLTAERNELDVLTGQPVRFRVPMRSILRRFSKTRERAFILEQPYLGTLDRLSAEYIRLELDEDAFNENPFAESKRVVAQNAQRAARIVAIAVLNSHWKIKWLLGIYTRYFLWRINTQKLSELILLIYPMASLVDFTHAIRYLSVTPRTSSPNLVAETTSQQEEVEVLD